MKRVAITGGAGSLGRSFMEFLTKEGYSLVVIERSESSLAAARRAYPQHSYLLQDFADYNFTLNPVDYLIHAAASKHVDLGESNPTTFAHNNIMKTDQLLRAAHQAGVQTLYISTDKAVEPVSVYGASKMIAEAVARQYSMSVARLGNLLNASGSVLPIWETQLKNNQPLTLTDKRMSRYYIDPDEAVRQIWPRFIAGEKLIVPDMGEEVGLLDLCQKFLADHGFKTIEDYQPGLTEIGIRPGEKVTEKLYWDTELTD